MRVQYALLSRLHVYTFVRTCVILPYCIFRLCSYVRVPLSPDRGLPLSANSVLHIRPQISTECLQPVIVGLICNIKQIYKFVHSRSD